MSHKKTDDPPSSPFVTYGAYPMQTPYPVQPSAPYMENERLMQYPQTSSQPTPYLQTGMQSNYGKGPSEPPPPYSPAVGQPCYYNTYHPQPTQMYPVAACPYPQQQNVAVGAVFDAGARFTRGAPPSIPPPPPGIAPNTAQVAMMQGHNVVASKKKSGILEGSGDVGFTTW